MPTTLQQLEGLPLRLIALKLSNPGPLAASCSTAYRSLSAPDFQLDWFMHWVLLLAPLRPWQFSVIGWRRLGGPHATAEQLCSFMLRVGDRLNAGRRNRSATDKWSDPAHTIMPHCAPSNSVQHTARRLLAQGKHMAALTWLCPGRQPLIYPYVAAAGNALLLQQLISKQGEMRSVNYPNSMMQLSYAVNCTRTVDTAKLCAYAALRAGNEQLLATILISGGASIKRQVFQVWQLFRFAVRHSSAACVLQLLAFAPCHDWVGHGHHYNDTLSASPQHLAMAAARSDPWAAEVVGVLLRAMPQKLLTAKYMRPVYEAACKSGHISVLQQLVLYTAALPRTEHLALLLEGAAAAANLRVWRQLLMLGVDGAAGSSGSTCGDSNSSDSSRPRLGSRLLSLLGRALLGRRRQQQAPLPLTEPHADSRQQDGWEEQQQQEPASLQGVQYLPWDRLDSQHKADALLAILDGMCTYSNGSDNRGIQHLHLAADADRVAMADGLLLRLGGEQSVRRAIRAQLSEQACPFASFGALQELLASSLTPAGKVAWLYAHDMLPVLPAGWQLSPAAAEGLLHMIGFSLSHGQRRATDALVQFAWGLDLTVPQEMLVQGCLEAAVRAAGAQQDLGEIERLSGFAEFKTRLAAFAKSAWQGVSSEGLPAEKQLLFGLAAAWNAAVVLDAEGLPALLGLPLTQHLQICAAAVLPVMLRSVPLAAGVILRWLSDTGLTQSCMSESGCAAAVAPLALHLTRLLQGDGEEVGPQSVIQCLMQLAGEWRTWSAQGPQQQVLPCISGPYVGLVGVPLQAAHPAARAAAKAAATAAEAEAAGIGPAGVRAVQQLALASVPICTLPDVDANAVAFALVTAERDMCEPELLRLGAPARASCSNSSSSSMEPACGGPGESASAGAAADPPPLQDAGQTTLVRVELAARAYAQGQLVLFPWQEPRPPPPSAGSSSASPVPRQSSILPLWAQAALALAAKNAREQPWQDSSLGLAVPYSLAVQSILQGRQGQRRGASEPSVHATAGSSYTPSFLVPLAVAATEGPQLAVALERAAVPAQPPEHRELTHIISSSSWMQQKGRGWLPGLFDRYQPPWAATALRRLDVAAWGLQQQRGVWACDDQWRELALSLTINSSNTSSLTHRPGSSPVWADHCQQQLLQHRQQLAAGFSAGECGALPAFAAGAADAAIVLLRQGVPTHISSMVQQLGGGSSAAQVLRVKAVLAATLAVLWHRVHCIDELMRRADEHSSWVRVKPVALRKALELGDIDLFTLLSLYDDLVLWFRPPTAHSWHLAAEV